MNGKLGKHIDLIAIALLLLGAAVYSHARRVIVVNPFGPSRVILIQRDARPPVFVLPKLPALSFHRG